MNEENDDVFKIKRDHGARIEGEIYPGDALEERLTIHQYSLPKEEAPFKKLRLRDRCICVLRLAKFSQGEIARVIKTSRMTVSRALDKARSMYPKFRNRI